MKKTIIALSLLAAVVSSQGQGYVLFQNAGNARVSTNGVATGRIAANDGTVANTFYFALFTSTAQNTTVGSSSAAISGTNGTYAFNASGWTFAPNAIGTNTIAGQFTSTVADPNNSLQTQIPSGAAQTFVILGWSANIGSTLSALTTWYNNGNPATSGFIGESAVSGVITPSVGGVSLTAPITGTTTGLIPGFTLGQVIAPTPEPATLALAGLSGASLLLFRRRK
jgi:hypothetical protein